jgi:hypothetical protein
MDASTESGPNRLSRTLLRRAGRAFIPAWILIAQLLLVPGLVIWLVILRINAQFTPEQLNTITGLMAGLAVGSSLALVGSAYYLTRAAGQRLGRWARNETLTTGSPEELAAWRQITAAPWRYSYLSLFILTQVIMLPVLGYCYFTLSATSDQLTYALMGGVVAVVATTILTALLTERVLAPAREVLLPRTFEAQLAGAAGLRIQRKFLATVLALIGISVLLIAPIGYHMSYVILFEPLASEQVFEQLQVQSLVASGLAILLGVVLTYMLSRSISSPVNHLIEVSTVSSKGIQSASQALATDEVGELAVYFNRMIARLEELQSTLENQVQARTAQLEATIEVGRVASAILDPDQLIAKVTNLITDRFGYYYAAIFIIDQNGAWAELKGASGEAGRILTERRHRLPIGGKSMVSTAIQTRRGKMPGCWRRAHGSITRCPHSLRIATPSPGTVSWVRWMSVCAGCGLRREGREHASEHGQPGCHRP